MTLNQTAHINRQPFFLGAMFSCGIFVAITLLSANTTVIGLSNAVWTFILLSFFGFIASVWIVFYYQSHQQTIPISWILATAILFRIIGLCGYPLFEDDYYRYLWDGYRTWTDGNPYSYAPAFFFADGTVPALFDDILSNINYPDIATVYGPVCQWIFSLSYLIAAGEIWPLQVLSVLFDVGILYLLTRLGPSNYLLLYAWSPLIIKEFTITAHPEIYGVFFAIAAIWAHRSGYWFTAGILLALAVGAKVFALLVIPVLLASSLNWSSLIKVTVGFIVTIGLITASFTSIAIWWPEGLQAMASDWLFNAPAYLLFSKYLQFDTAKLGFLGSFVVGYIIYCLYILKATSNLSLPRFLTKFSLIKQPNSTNQPIRYDYIFAALLICLPAFNAWYLLWVLVFAAIYPSRWSWVASFTLLFSYLTPLNLNSSDSFDLHQLSTAVIAIEFMLIFLAFIWDQKSPLPHFQRQPSTQKFSANR